MFQCPQYGFSARANDELAIDVAQVGLHGTDAQKKRLGDVFVGETLGQELQDVELPLGEGLNQAVANGFAAGERGKGTSRNVRRQADLTTSYGDDRTSQVTHRVVARETATGPSSQQWEDRTQLVGLDEKQETQIRGDSIELARQVRPRCGKVNQHRRRLVGL